MDVEKNKKMIENMNERMKHVSIIQNELVLLLEPIKLQTEESDNHTKNKMWNKLVNIQAQSKIVNSWINDTDLNEQLVSQNLKKVLKTNKAKTKKAHRESI